MLSAAHAPSPVDDVFREASKRRLLFGKAKRDVIDKWFNTLTARRSGLYVSPFILVRELLC